MNKNIFYIGKKWVLTWKIENYSNIIPRTVIQHKCSIFMEQLPNRNSKLKFDIIAYRVDFWLMSCSSVPYSLLLKATNKYLQTESGDFKASEHKNNLTF